MPVMISFPGRSQQCISLLFWLIRLFYVSVPATAVVFSMPAHNDGGFAFEKRFVFKVESKNYCWWKMKADGIIHALNSVIEMNVNRTDQSCNLSLFAKHLLLALISFKIKCSERRKKQMGIWTVWKRRWLRQVAVFWVAGIESPRNGMHSGAVRNIISYFAL